MNEPQQPTEEQLLDALRQIKTEDVVVQTVATLVNLAGQKLSVEGAKDPAEAQKAIDAARQMLPLVPQEAVSPIQNALDQVQMLYAKESQGAPPAPPRSRLSRRSGRPARDRDLRRLRLLQVPRRHDRGAGRNAVRAALRAGTRRKHRGHRRRVHASPRRRAHAAASPHQLPGEHLGDEGGGRRPDHRPLGLRLAQAGARAGHLRALRPVRRSHRRAREHLLRRAADHPRLRRRPLLPRSARGARRGARGRRASRSWRAGRSW